MALPRVYKELITEIHLSFLSFLAVKLQIQAYSSWAVNRLLFYKQYALVQ